MKNLIVVFLFIVILGGINVSAGDKKVNTKFGKPTNQEMEMTIYDSDKEAEAVVLSKLGEAEYTFDVHDGFKVTYKYETRIKILKPEGAKYADIRIDYYHVDNRNFMRDEVFNIKANSYNLVDGKIEKTELKKNMIYDEQIYDEHRAIKFSIPNVKVGSVIEYKYEIRSTRIPYLRSWYAQAEIPVLYSFFEVAIPKYFKFNILPRGYGHMKIDRSKTIARFNMMIGVVSELIDVESERIEIESRELPAMRGDGFVYGLNDFVAHVDFEMKGVEVPGQPYQNFASSWENVDKSLLDGGFGRVYKMKNPYPEASVLAREIEDINTKVELILSFVAGKIKWNGRYNLIMSKEEMELGSGSSATINSMIISMLRDAGIESYAVALRLRKNGTLFKFLPSLDNLDTFVVAYVDEEGKMHFVDGTDVFNAIDVLPLNMLVADARIISSDYQGERWVSLDKVSRNGLKMAVTATIDAENGVVNCKEQQKLTGQMASAFRHAYASSTDSAAYVNDLATYQNVTLNDIIIKGASPRQQQVVVMSDYDKTIEMTDSLIYINPTIIPILAENPFTSVTRELPVMFPYCKEQVTFVNIAIPDGYIIEELPASIALQTENGELQYIFSVKDMGNSIVVMSKFVLTEMTHPVESYEMLRSFYSHIVDKCNEMIVLRKQ